MTEIIQGAGGGGKGASGGYVGVTNPINTLRSSQKALILDAWCEGPIKGLVNGAQSVYFNRTPLQNSDSSWNFNQVVLEYATGTPGAVGVTNAAGYAGSDAQDAISVQQQCFSGVAVTQAVTAANINAALVTLQVNGLSITDPQTGQITGTSVEFTIAVENSGAGYVTMVTDSINGLTNSAYSRDYLIPLSGTGPWNIQVTKVTADSTDSLLINSLSWTTMTEVSNALLAYPHTAMAAIAVDAMQFSSIPSRAYLVDGLIIQVPSNYDPTTRVYTGTWDGTFQLAFSNNPAWCFYDLLTNERYGLGGLIDATVIDKWQLY
ncbi:MAG: phage tail protein, partial [Ferrovum sp.]|nr:phage tail protein [Ferrovum sp.]